MQSAIEGLANLFNAGHYQQVANNGRQYLQQYPADLHLHYYTGLAFVNLGELNEVKPHVDAVLQIGPENPISHHLAAVYFHNKNQPRKARKHIESAIELDPQCAIYHGLAASIAAALFDEKEARLRIDSALELDPSNPEYIRLSVLIRGATTETKASDAWNHLQVLKDALALDPNNASLHAGIGDIFLDDLDLPAEAEVWYRQALAIDPLDREVQKSLFRAVGKQRIVYQVLSLPERAFTWIGLMLQAIKAKPLRLVWFLIGWKFVVGFLLWLVVAIVIFWPAAKFYEWLLIREIRCASGAFNSQLRLKRSLSRWPFAIRLGAFLLLMAGCWLLVFSVLGAPVIKGFVFVGIFAGVNFLLVLTWMLYRKVRRAFGRWRYGKQPKAPLARTT